jgi:hypothetical protein
MKYLRSRVISIRPQNGKVQIIGRVFQSPNPETHTVPVGYKIFIPDDHGSIVFTIARIDVDGVLVEYESSFENLSFRTIGKYLIERDNGSFKIEWFDTTRN